MKNLKFLVFLTSILHGYNVEAQVSGVDYGFEDHIRNAETISVEEEFGETISPVLGSIDWSFTDLHIPLAGPDIKIGRTLKTSSFYPYSPNYFPSEIYDWSLNVPKIYLNFWGFRQSSLAACGIDHVKNIQIAIPGVTGFDPVGRGQSTINFPSNTAIYFANNWVLKCEPFATRSQSIKNNGQTLQSKNEQFTLVSPQGVTYHFRYNNNRDFSSNVNYSKAETVWKINTFYVTDIEDKFGNWLTYDYKEVVLDSELDYKGEPRSTHLLLEKIRSSANVSVSLNNDNKNITGFSYGGKTVEYIPKTTHWSGPGDYTTVINGKTLTFKNSTTYLNKVSYSDSDDTFYWTFNHSEFGHQSPSGLFSNKGLTSIENPWGGKVNYSYQYRNFGCSRNHIELPLIDYSLRTRTYSDHNNSNSVEYEVNRKWDTNYPQSLYPADDFAYTIVSYPDRIEKYEYHCARFESYYLSDNKDYRLKAVTIESLDGDTVKETEYTWKEIPHSYIDDSFIWHDSNGPNKIVLDEIKINKNYSTEFLEYDEFGLSEKVLEENEDANLKKYTRYEYYNDQESWLIGLPKKTQISYSDSNYKTISQTTYHSDSIGSRAYAKLGLPFRKYDYDSWKKEFTSYQKDGEVSRITYNVPLTYGSGNRYIVFQNYKRGVPQTIKTPNNDSDIEKSKYNIVDDLGRITKISDFEGNCSNYAYNSIGWLTSETQCDSNWKITKFSYSFATLSDAYINYVEEGMLVKKVSLGSYRKDTFYDGMLRPVLVGTYDITEPSKISYQRFGYNNNGSLTFSSFQSEGSETQYGIVREYDELNRLVVIDDNSSSGEITYEYLPNDKIRANDNKNNESTISYRAFGSPSYSLPSLIEMGPSDKTTIRYNLFDKITLINQGGIEESRVYDKNQYLCKRIRPDTGNEAFLRNNLGEMKWSAHGPSVSSSSTSCDTSVSNSEKTVFTYGNNGKVVLINYGDTSPDKKMTFYKNGLIKTIKAGANSNIYSYNTANLIEKETVKIDSKTFAFEYHYDSSKNLESNTYPDGEIVRYSPNAFNQPTRASAYASHAIYHPNGNIKQFTYGNGFTHHSSQYSNGLPKDFYDKKGTQKAIDHYFEFDSNGNLTYLKDKINSLYNLDLGYDHLNRLSEINDTYLGSGSVDYNSSNDITNLKMGNHIIDYTYDQNSKRLTSTKGSRKYLFDYDSRGNVTNNGFTIFDYNLAQQVIQSNTSGNKVSYVYDGNDRRVKTTTDGKNTYYFYNRSGKLIYVENEDLDRTNKIYLGKRLIAENKTSIIKPVAINNIIIDGRNYNLFNSQQSAIGFTKNLDRDRAETLSWLVPENSETNVIFQYKIDFGTSGSSSRYNDVNWTLYGKYSSDIDSTTLYYDVGPITENNVPSGYSSKSNNYAKLHLRVKSENSSGSSEWRYLKPVWVYFND